MFVTKSLILVMLGITIAQGDWRFSGDNIAFNKTTIQGPGTWLNYTASLAVDGNYDSFPDNGHCSIATSLYNTTAFWSVDLGDMYYLKGILISNQDNNRHLLRNFQIIGYPSGTLVYDDRTANPPRYNDLSIDISVYSTTAISNITILSPATRDLPVNEYPNLVLCEVVIIAIRDETDRRCPPPGNVINGYYVQCLCKDNFYIYETVTWECTNGYISEQNRIMTCLEDMQWSVTEPECSLPTCSFLVEPYVQLTFDNGSNYESGNIAANTVVGVTCDKGYRTHQSYITCSSTGQWNQIPTCMRIECIDLGNLTGGSNTYIGTNLTTLDKKTKWLYGAVVTGECISNFSLTGSSTRTCGEDGTWTGDKISCVPLGQSSESSSCKFPSSILAGVSAGTFVVGCVIGVLVSCVVMKCRKTTP